MAPFLSSRAAGPPAGEGRRPPRTAAPGVVVRAGAAVTGIHAALLAAAHWLIFDQLRERAAPDQGEALAAAFRAYGTSLLAAEGAQLALAVLAIAGALTLAGYRHGRTAAAALWTAAYAAPALYSLGLCVALLAGWTLDIWVLSSAEATPAEIAATITEALPIVLDPIAAGRLAATAVALLLFAVLQRRVLGLPSRDVMAATAAAASAAAVAQLLLA